jgi:6-pyruvoyltetrahydropterin/6-carboxytetrahydropterin synthase
MIVELEGKLNNEGMVIDFYDVEKIVKPIIDKLDHAFMVKNDDKDVLEFLEKVRSKKVVVDFNATVENICVYVKNEIKKFQLPQNITAVGVKIYETNEDYAEERFIIKE